jgi:hypothetical protein
MYPNQPAKRRRRDFAVSAESLETRELLTGGAGNTFAILPATVTQAGQTSVVKFTIDATHFTTPRHQITLGVDVVADPSSKIQPKIVSIKPAAGGVADQTIHARYDPHINQLKVAVGSMTSAVISPLHLTAGKSETFTVAVKGMNNTTGKYLLGFYLPGDVNGDGVVDKTDITALKAALGSHAGDTKYNFDADSNRDGKVSAADLQYAMQNMGVKTTISPVVSANLDQSTNALLSTRVSKIPLVKFLGQASPGATVTFDEASGKNTPVTATADSKGNYSAVVNLAPGSNTFNVTTMDGFGQSISGTLAPVTYDTSAAITPAQLAALESQLNPNGRTPTGTTSTTPTGKG